jgi:hypothetical protein
VNNAAGEPEIERPLYHAFAPQPIRDAQLLHKRNRMLFEDAGADASLDMASRPRFQNHAIDAGAMQQQ